MARNKYPEVTVEKILDAAQRLFLEKGYDNTTIQDIVDELGGLTKGAIYHHFKSKEEIMDALSEKMFTSNNPFEEVKKRKDLNALEKMRLAIRHHGVDLPYRTFDKRPQVNQAAIVENKRLGPILAYIAEQQKQLDMSRSAKAPRRRGQKNHMFKIG